MTAGVEQHTKTESFIKGKKKYVVSEWIDAEDWGAMIIPFEDHSKDTVFTSDTVLGEVKNVMPVYLSNAVVNVNINRHDALIVYAPEQHIFGDEHIPGKLESKVSWNFPSRDEDWMRGFPKEFEDFINALLFDRAPISGIELARDVIEVIYGAYASAEKGIRIEVKENRKGMIWGKSELIHTY